MFYSFRKYQYKKQRVSETIAFIVKLRALYGNAIHILQIIKIEHHLQLSYMEERKIDIEVYYRKKIYSKYEDDRT